MKTLFFLGCTLALVSFTDQSLAKSSGEVQAIARSSTVEIRLKNSVGSGVIIHRQGEVYTLVTNRHVVCGGSRCSQVPLGNSYSLGLADGQKYRVNGGAVKLLGQDLDLAIVQFRSNRNYGVAMVAGALLRVDDAVYTAGFPYAKPGFSFNRGRAIAVANKRLKNDKGGYSIIYNAETLPGMSGGGVFNHTGELVAIHGVGDRYQPGADLGDDDRLGMKVGYNRGIPVRWLVQNLATIGIQLGGFASVGNSPSEAAATADEHFITGFNKSIEPGDNVIAGKRQAIQEFSIALRINPQYANAYFTRAYIYDQLQEFQRALKDYDQAIKIDPQFTSAYTNRGLLKVSRFNDAQGALTDYNQAIAINPQYLDAYLNRGLLKADQLKDTAGALADYNRAIMLDSKFSQAYYNRGVLKDSLNDISGALADYNQAIELNPNYAKAYNNRATLKFEKLNDLTGALADLDRAIALKPKFAEAYSNRALLKQCKMNDPQGALADYNRAASLAPNLAQIYNNRGNLKHMQLQDISGALADFNRAIALNPQYAEAYLNRGILKGDKLQDQSGAIQDWRKAEKLFRNQGNLQIANQIRTALQKLER